MVRNFLLIFCLVSFAVSFRIGNALGSQYDDGLRAYEQGDYAKAIAVWLELAESGESQAQNEIGSMYYHGIGLPKNVS